MAKTRLILDSSGQYKYKYRVREYVFTHTKVAYKQKNVKTFVGSQSGLCENFMPDTCIECIASTPTLFQRTVLAAGEKNQVMRAQSMIKLSQQSLSKSCGKPPEENHT